MHSSYPLFILFLAVPILAGVGQVLNFVSIERSQRTFARKLALALGVSAILLAAVSGYLAAIDWTRLPKSPDGLSHGQLWDDGGLPAIVE